MCINGDDASFFPQRRTIDSIITTDNLPFMHLAHRVAILKVGKIDPVYV
jgi:hypothetical protein